MFLYRCAMFFLFCGVVLVSCSRPPQSTGKPGEKGQESVPLVDGGAKDSGFLGQESQQPESTTPELRPSPEKPAKDADGTSCQPIPQTKITSTWEQVKKQSPKGTGMMVYQNGTKLFEAYAPKNVHPILPSGGGPNRNYLLYSKTKSLAGLTALLLIKDKKLTLETKVSKFVPAWQKHPQKKMITIKELLTLSSGIRTKIVFPDKMTLAQAINAPFEKKQFAYGTHPFIVFAHVVKTITGRRASAYLKTELLDKIGAKINIGQIKDGVTNFASGGSATLAAVRRLGQELIDATQNRGKVFNASDIQTLIRSTGLNPAYGLTVWVNRPGKDATGKVTPAQWPSCSTNDMFSFLGAGGQILTLLPEHRLVVVKSSSIGKVNGQHQASFWTTLFDQLPCACLSP